VNSFLGCLNQGFNVCCSGVTGVYNKITVEWGNLGSSYRKAFESAFIYEFSGRGSESVVILKNAAGARVFEVSFIYAFCYIFFAFLFDIGLKFVIPVILVALLYIGLK
jgi:hypothetical protein